MIIVNFLKVIINKDLFSKVTSFNYSEKNQEWK